MQKNNKNVAMCELRGRYFDTVYCKIQCKFGHILNKMHTDFAICELASKSNCKHVHFNFIVICDLANSNN